MTRQTKLGDVLDPGERIDLDAALRMFTADAAWAWHRWGRVLAGSQQAPCAVQVEPADPRQGFSG
jgi:predicted amidohydrolase YtcJ